MHICDDDKPKEYGKVEITETMDPTKENRNPEDLDNQSNQQPEDI